MLAEMEDVHLAREPWLKEQRRSFWKRPSPSTRA